MAITENNTTFVAGTEALLGKELEFITIDAGEELANHLLKGETLNAIENTVRIYGNIVGAGPLFDTNASKTYIVEVPPSAGESVAESHSRTCNGLLPDTPPSPA